MHIFEDPSFFESLSPQECQRTDEALGLEVNQIELDLLSKARALMPMGDVTSWGKSLHEAQSWVGLHPQTLLTPYQELAWMCECVKDQSGHVVDLGAGYGRLGIIMQEKLPLAFYTGVEIVKQRVDEGNRVFEKLHCEKARLIAADLASSSYELPLGDCYFIYDYGTLDHIRWTMGQLQNLSDIHRFQIVARGAGIRSLIDMAHPWLHKMENPHEAFFSLYQTHLT